MEIVSSKPTITRQELERVLDCLINNELTKGNVIKNFETHIAELQNSKFSLAVNSLTAAYHLAFEALELKKDDEIIIPSYFSTAPLNAAKILGLKPILVDLAENSFTPSINLIKEKITDKTKAIILGHTFGFFQDITPIYDLKIPIIEDISAVIGDEFEGKIVGYGASIAIADFSPNNIITTGNGAMLFTNNSRFYSTMRKLRNFNPKKPDIFYDYVMTDFQGAMGISQLALLQDFIKFRKIIAKQYYHSLKMTPHKTFYSFNEEFSYQVFPIIFDASGEKVEKFFKKNGIELVKPIQAPLHLILGLNNMDYPQSDRLSKKLYSLPIYPTLTKKEIEKISRTLAKFI